VGEAWGGIIMKVKQMVYRVVVHKAEEGGFWAEVPSLPGCVSEGDSMEELRANIKEAILGWLEVADLISSQEPDTETIEVAV
jgi:predicted RNase H-like HicB family nuclease